MCSQVILPIDLGYDGQCHWIDTLTYFCSMFYCCYTNYFIESCAMHTCTDVTRNKYNDTILIMTIIFY